jgi:hypothetical protein
MDWSSSTNQIGFICFCPLRRQPVIVVMVAGSLSRHADSNESGQRYQQLEISASGLLSHSITVVLLNQVAANVSPSPIRLPRLTPAGRKFGP